MIHTPEFSTPPVLSDDVLNCALAVAKGVGKSVTGFAHMVAHPLDSLVYPVSSLVYDASIISAAHHNQLQNGAQLVFQDFADLQTVVSRHPQLYSDARARMESRVQCAKDDFREFANADIDQQVETISHTISSFYLPGAMIRGFQTIRNLERFGISNPPLFHTHIEHELVMPYDGFRKYNAVYIRNVKEWEIMQYVVTKDNHLVITPTTAMQPFNRTPNSKGIEWITDQIFHSDMAQLKPVYAAGDIVVRDGKIIKIDNKSGHYHPGGEHMGDLIEKVFADNGFPESIGKYSDTGYTFSSKSVMTKNKLKPHVAGVALLNKSTDDNTVGDITVDTNDSTISQITNFAKQVPIAIKQLETLPNELTPQTRKQLFDISETLFAYGQIGLGVSQIALMTGGHQRTWKGVAGAAQSTMSLANSISAVASAKTMMSLSAITGYIGIAIAGISLAMSLFGDSGPDPMEEMMKELHAIHTSIRNMHNDILKIGRRLEELLIVSVLDELHQINAKMDRLERIMCSSFKELHGKDLIYIIDAIKKDMCGEHSLTTSEKREHMRQLSTWIDFHSKSPIQTAAFQNNGDKYKVLELLQNSLSVMDNLPLALSTVCAILPTIKCKINTIPNVHIFAMVCDVYTLAETRYGMRNDKLIERVYKTYDDILSSIEVCSNTENVIEPLLRQHKHYTLLLGDAVAKYRKEYSVSGPIGSVQKLIPGAAQKYVVEMITEVELRKQLLMTLCQLNNTIAGKVNQLNCTTSILECDTANNPSLFTAATSTDYNSLVRSIEMGSNVNTFDWWGQPIHYLTKHSSGKLQNLMLHTLFKIPQIEMGRRSLRDCGDTWGYGGTPILHVMNTPRPANAVLFCANGFDIIDSDGRGVPYGLVHFNNSHCGNLYWWCELNSCRTSMCQITLKMLKAMNSPDHTFNKKLLRGAYAYYKAVEAGFTQCADVSFECLLLLTCIIDDLRPLKQYFAEKPELLNTFNVYMVIKGIDISYYEFAIICDSGCLLEYFDKFPKKFTGPIDSNLIELSINNKAWNAARFLSTKYPDKFTTIQFGQIEDGLKLCNIIKDSPMVHLLDVPNITAFINEHVSKIKNRPISPTVSNGVIVKCKLFYELLLTFKLDSDLFYTLYRELGDSIQEENIIKTADLFDTIDALLRSKSEKYNLGTKIDNLIDILKQYNN